ncbi:MAG: dipeptide ABC transporter ATP-binding protein [Pseudomonadota bacterium]|nr:dipeptide ABC transporter ATP-binding protein [Pseudomonadota bacterium]
MSSSPILLEVQNLKKYFPVSGGFLKHKNKYIRAVDDISLTIEPGKTLGLVGESGCGKSTLGRAILHLEPPTSGNVFLEGRNIGLLSKKEMRLVRRDMQIIFQDPFSSLNPRKTVAQIVREPLDVHRVGTRSDRLNRVQYLLDMVGIRNNVLNRYPHEFSGGQRQRIGIARAIALDPKFVVADEPVSALDVSVQSQVLNLIAELQKSLNIGFLFISHDLAVVQHVSDFVAVMYLGKIVEQSNVRRIYSQPRHPYTKALLSAAPATGITPRDSRSKLKGDLPSALESMIGCSFHTRCPLAEARCRNESPEIRNVGGAEKHLIACHLATE